MRVSCVGVVLHKPREVHMPKRLATGNLARWRPASEGICLLIPADQVSLNTSPQKQLCAQRPAPPAAEDGNGAGRALGSLVEGTAFNSPCALQRSHCTSKYRLPSRADRSPRRTWLSPAFNKEMFNGCSSLIGNGGIQRNSDFMSQLTRKSDSPYTLMSSWS